MPVVIKTALFYLNLLMHFYFYLFIHKTPFLKTSLYFECYIFRNKNLYWKREKLPYNSFVRLSVGWPVCRNFKFAFSCSYPSTCSSIPHPRFLHPCISDVSVHVSLFLHSPLSLYLSLYPYIVRHIYRSELRV